MTFVYTLQEQQQNICYIANVGDSSAFLILKDGTTKPLTEEHRVSNPIEVERVAQKGGKIYRRRLEGELTLTRAIGDNRLENKGLTYEPYIERVSLDGNSKWMVIASDGL